MNTLQLIKVTNNSQEYSSHSAESKNEKTDICSICLEPFTIPVRLKCGHIFDLDCLASWFQQNQTCPIDRTTIKAEEVKFATDVIAKATASFNFIFLNKSPIHSIPIATTTPNQKIKKLIAHHFNKQSEDNLIQAVLSPIKQNYKPLEPRELFLILNLTDGNKRLYFDKSLSDYGILPGKEYKIAVKCIFAQYGKPCDYCYGNEDKEQTCNHSS